MRTLWFIGSCGVIIGLAVSAGWGGIAATVLAIVALVVGRALLLRSVQRAHADRWAASVEELAEAPTPQRGWHRDERDESVERWSNGTAWTPFTRPVGERRPARRPLAGRRPPGWLWEDPEAPLVQRWWDGQSWTEHRRPASAALLERPGALGRARVATVGVLVIAIVASQIAVTDGIARADERGSVVRVIDGDTVDVRVDDMTKRVRLLNIDTPETVDPARPVECLGPEATEFTESALPVGAAVVLRFDGDRQDGYGRTLAAVLTASGENVSEKLAAAGLGAPVDLGHGRFLGAVQAASDAAAASESGLFDADVECTAPGATRTLQAAAFTALATPAPAASLARLEAAATRASAFTKKLEVADPSTSTLWRLYSGAQQTSLRSSLDALRVRAREIQVRPAERRAAVAVEKAEAREKAEHAAALKKAAQKVAQKKAAAKRAAQQRAAARAAAAKKAAEKKAAEKAAERRASAARKAAADRAAVDQAQRSGGGSRSSGYTGCRQYAPGGQSWKPIPCPGH